MFRVHITYIFTHYILGINNSHINKKGISLKMTDYNEEEVDPELTTYLKEPIEKKKRTFKEAFEEETVDEEENDARDAPCSKKTRDEVYRLWAQKFDEEGAKLLPIVQKLETMSEAQAQAYLQCLRAVHSRSMHKNLTDKILWAASYVVCHPNDVTTPLAMQEDEYLSSGVSLIVSDVLAALGKLGFIMAVFLYAGSSRYLHKEPLKQSTPLTKTNPTREAIPPNGLLPSSDGQNNIND
jgi:hypothetical protein